MERRRERSKGYFRIIVTVNVLANHQDRIMLFSLRIQLKPNSTVQFLESSTLRKFPELIMGRFPESSLLFLR